MAITSISDITLNSMEYCYTVGAQHCGNSTFQVRNPKLLPLTSSNGIQVTTDIFNSKIFVNSSKCKPHVGKSVVKQNYMTVNRSTNCSLCHIADINGYIPSGSQVQCRCNDENPKDMTIVDG